MADGQSPATVVICAPDEGGTRVRSPAVTSVVTLHALLRDAPRDDGAAAALEIDPAWLESRAALRQALVRARHAAPRLEAAVVRGALGALHGLLAEEGIRVVLVEAFRDVGRGSRRPAPAGWPCRNVAWGLWEVKACPPRRSPGWAWLPGLPAARRGGLHVVAAGDQRLGRLVDWSAQAAARGQAVVVTLAELPAILEGRTSGAMAASVLRAA